LGRDLPMERVAFQAPAPASVVVATQANVSGLSYTKAR
jgi:hypothetical protein